MVCVLHAFSKLFLLALEYVTIKS